MVQSIQALDICGCSLSAIEYYLRCLQSDAEKDIDKLDTSTKIDFIFADNSVFRFVVANYKVRVEIFDTEGTCLQYNVFPVWCTHEKIMEWVLMYENIGTAIFKAEAVVKQAFKKISEH